MALQLKLSGGKVGSIEKWAVALNCSRSMHLEIYCGTFVCVSVCVCLYGGQRVI